MKITYEMLKRAGACSRALVEFSILFGDAADVTPENAKKVTESEWLGGNQTFLATSFLNDRGLEEWNRLAPSFKHVFDIEGTCLGCTEALLAFVELFNQEEYRKSEKLLNL